MVILWLDVSSGGGRGGYCPCICVLLLVSTAPGQAGKEQCDSVYEWFDVVMTMCVPCEHLCGRGKVTHEVCLKECPVYYEKHHVLPFLTRHGQDKASTPMPDISPPLNGQGSNKTGPPSDVKGKNGVAPKRPFLLAEKLLIGVTSGLLLITLLLCFVYCVIPHCRQNCPLGKKKKERIENVSLEELGSPTTEQESIATTAFGGPQRRNGDGGNEPDDPAPQPPSLPEVIVEPSRLRESSAARCTDTGTSSNTGSRHGSQYEQENERNEQASAARPDADVEMETVPKVIDASDITSCYPMEGGTDSPFQTPGERRFRLTPERFATTLGNQPPAADSNASGKQTPPESHQSRTWSKSGSSSTPRDRASSTDVCGDQAQPKSHQSRTRSKSGSSSTSRDRALRTDDTSARASSGKSATHTDSGRSGASETEDERSRLLAEQPRDIGWLALDPQETKRESISHQPSTEFQHSSVDGEEENLAMPLLSAQSIAENETEPEPSNLPPKSTATDDNLSPISTLSLQPDETESLGNRKMQQPANTRSDDDTKGGLGCRKVTMEGGHSNLPVDNLANMLGGRNNQVLVVNIKDPPDAEAVPSSSKLDSGYETVPHETYQSRGQGDQMRSSLEQLSEVEKEASDEDLQDTFVVPHDVESASNKDYSSGTS